ncbi:MAG: alpha/beta fold hydrolase, partial [Candidatus Moraniibacteriota bacterium]
MFYMKDTFENPQRNDGNSEHSGESGSQYIRREEWTIETAGGKTKVYEFIPKDPVSEVPVFLASGFGGTVEIYKSGILDFARENRRRVITIDHPRFGGRPIESNERNSASTELSRRALNIAEVIKELERKGTPKIDAITHSEGTINLIEAASENPEHFRHIILFAPAGLIDTTVKENFAASIANLVRNFVSDLFKSHASESEEEKQRGKIAFQKGAICVLQNIFRSIEEVVGIAATSLKKNLEKIRSTSDRENLGIKIVVAAPIDDTVFPF